MPPTMPFKPFPADFALEPYTVRLGYALGTDNRSHAFGTLAGVSGQGGYMTTHCGAFWQNVTPETLGVLSANRAEFRGLTNTTRCGDCYVQDTRLHDSEIPAPAVSLGVTLSAVQAQAQSGA